MMLDENYMRMNDVAPPIPITRLNNTRKYMLLNIAIWMDIFPLYFNYLVWRINVSSISKSSNFTDLKILPLHMCPIARATNDEFKDQAVCGVLEYICFFFTLIKQSSAFFLLLFGLVGGLFLFAMKTNRWVDFVFAA